LTFSRDFLKWKYMINRDTKSITLPGSAFRKKEGVVILPLKKWQRIEKENLELRAAIEAILAGELALQKKQSRSFREFLKSEFPSYVKS